MKLLLASENQGKLREMRALLPPEIEIILSSELGFTLKNDETGTTFEENARIKAKNACLLSGLPSVADDSGLCVDALGGAPGVRSRRFGSEELSDTQRCELLLKTLGDMEHRSAKFVSAIVCHFPNGDEITASGECRGEITLEKCGESGFGYDPIFYVPGYGRTMAEITPEEKNTISHRGTAMRIFTEKLESYIEENK